MNAWAQDKGAQPELRADVLLARESSVQVGAGASWILGTYVRLALLGGAGVANVRLESPAGADAPRAFRASARGDLLLRFSLDPFRQSKWSLYGAGGLGVLYDPSRDWRGVLVVAVGLEGPVSRRVLPALELGVGGGTRIGVIIRRARRTLR
jgi:hypothetical protein